MFIISNYFISFLFVNFFSLLFCFVSRSGIFHLISWIMYQMMIFSARFFFFIKWCLILYLFWPEFMNWVKYFFDWKPFINEAEREECCEWCSRVRRLEKKSCCAACNCSVRSKMDNQLKVNDQLAGNSWLWLVNEKCFSLPFFYAVPLKIRSNEMADIAGRMGNYRGNWAWKVLRKKSICAWNNPHRY